MSNAPHLRRKSQKIFKCTSSNGPPVWLLGVCGQVFHLSTRRWTTHNASSGSTTFLVPHNFQPSCSNTNSPKRVLSLDSSYGAIHSERIGSYSTKLLTTYSSVPSTDVSSALTCIRTHPMGKQRTTLASYHTTMMKKRIRICMMTHLTPTVSNSPCAAKFYIHSCLPG